MAVLPHNDYYFHAPGHPSRWGVVDVGLKCMHSCKFCYYSYMDDAEDQFGGMRHAKFHTREHLLTLVDSLKENGFLGFDVTGGEPTLHPDIVDVIAHASSLGLSSRIITLGQYLMRPMRKSSQSLLKELLGAGVTNFLFSLHAVDPALFHALTGESLDKLVLAMQALDEAGFDYCSNTTVLEDNYRTLPAIAEEIVKHNIYMHNFILMNAYYAWEDRGRAAPVQAKYGHVHPYLREAVAILESHGVAVNIRYAPLCTMAGLEKNVVGITGVRHDPYEWMNDINHGPLDPERDVALTHNPQAMGRRLAFEPNTPPGFASIIPVAAQRYTYELHAGRGNPEFLAKAFPQSPCAKCTAVTVCDGIDPRYVERTGSAELVPYVGRSRGHVLDFARLAYRPAFYVKRNPMAPMRKILKDVFAPQGVSPSASVVIVITAYNKGERLRKAIDSALAQTHKQTHVVVVDDGSTDGTRALCAAYGDRITYIYQENSGQPAYGRNAGIRATRSDLVMCLDADDWIEPSYVEECMRVMRADPSASLAYTGTQCFGLDEAVWDANPYNFRKMLMENIFVYAALYKRDVWQAVGGYRTNVRGCEDYDFWVAAAGLGFVGAPLQRGLFHYYRNSEGLFEQDVLPNMETKYRQIVLNNSDLYPPDMVRQAANGEAVQRLPYDEFLPSDVTRAYYREVKRMIAGA